MSSKSSSELETKSIVEHPDETVHANVLSERLMVEQTLALGLRVGEDS